MGAVRVYAVHARYCQGRSHTLLPNACESRSRRRSHRHRRSDQKRHFRTRLWGSMTTSCISASPLPRVSTTKHLFSQISTRGVRLGRLSRSSVGRGRRQVFGLETGCPFTDLRYFSSRDAKGDQKVMMGLRASSLEFSMPAMHGVIVHAGRTQHLNPHIFVHGWGTAGG